MILLLLFDLLFLLSTTKDEHKEKKQELQKGALAIDTSLCA